MAEETIATTACACGCGEPVSPGKVWVHGHHRRGRPSERSEEAEDLTLVALKPADMAPAQAQLVGWCDRKIAAVRAELADLDANVELATEHGWKHRSVEGSLTRTRKRILYYEKLKAAAAAGYLIIPNLPVDVFAVRVQRSTQRKTVHHDGANFSANPELLPAGEGRYVDEQLLYTDESYVDDSDHAKPKRVARYVSGDYDTADFPVQLVKPAILDATGRAMALKIFDEMGIVENRSGRRGDPIVVGRLRDPRGNGRCATFFVAWWLDTASL